MLSNLRAATTLDSEDFDIPLISDDTADAGVESRLEKTILSAALINTALEMHEETKGGSSIAFMAIVDRTWNKDKRLAPLYRSRRSFDMGEMEKQIFARVAMKMQDAR